MQVIITSGHPHSGYLGVHKELELGGIDSAQPSRREGVTPTTLTESLLRAHNSDPNVSGIVGQLSPGKAWQELAVDLFLGNLSQRNWGWADASTTWLLDFWLQFDEQTRFVLVYSSPSITIAKLMMQSDAKIDSLSVAVQSWIRWNSELLRFSSRHPERCLLVNAGAASQEPGALFSSANDLFDLGLNMPADAVPSNTGNLSALPSFLMDCMLEEFSETTSLFEELQSAAHIAGRHDQVRPEAARDAWEDYLASVTSCAKLHAAVEQLTARCHRAESEAQFAESDRNDARDQIEKISSLLSDSQAALEKRSEQESQLEIRNNQLKEENDILFLQMRQLQDALEQTESAYRESERQRLEASSRPNVAPTPSVSPRSTSQLVELALDMRQKIDGKNWYWAEHDGRWAGPETHGTLRLPAMGPGRYEVKLEVVDAMNPEILAGMQVTLCGIPLVLAREGKAYPSILKGVVNIEDAGLGGDWDISFQFPSLSSPAQRGSSDSRQLAIRLRSLRLRALLDSNERSSATN